MHRFSFTGRNPGRIRYNTLYMIKRIYIELTNRCDLSCPFCLKHPRPLQDMTPDFFARVAEQAVQITPHLYLHVQGEPLLHPQFSEILSICTRLNANVHLVTNGSFLYRYPDLPLHPCIRNIAVSLQSVSARSPQSISSYLDSVIKLAHECSALGKPYLDLRFWRSDQMTDKTTAACLNRLRSEFVLSPCSRTGTMKFADNCFVSFANDFEWPDGSGQASAEGTCLGGREQIAILSSGTVVPCCLDAGGAVNLGNLHNSTLSKILSSPRYCSLIEGFRRHEIREPFCQTCSYRSRFQ